MSTAQCWHYSCFCYLKRYCYTYFSELLCIPSAATTTVLLTFVAFFVPPPATSHFCNKAKFKKACYSPLSLACMCKCTCTDNCSFSSWFAFSGGSVPLVSRNTYMSDICVYLFLQASKLVCASMLLNITLMGLLVQSILNGIDGDQSDRSLEWHHSSILLNVSRGSWKCRSGDAMISSNVDV